MTPLAQIQNVSVHVTPLGDVTLHLPFALLQHDQAVLGLNENEAFAQIFAQELMRSPAAARASQLQNPLIGPRSTLARSEESGDAVDATEAPLEQTYQPTEPEFLQVSEASESIDVANAGATVVINLFDQSSTSHQVAQDDGIDANINEVGPHQPVLGEDLLPVEEQRLMTPSQFGGVAMAVSSDMEAEMLRGAVSYDKPSAQTPSQIPAMLQLSSALITAPKAPEPQAPLGTNPITLSPSGMADQLLNEPVPALILPAVPPDAILPVMAVYRKGLTPIGAATPVHEEPLPSQPDLVKSSAQDKIKVSAPPIPSTSPQDIKPGFHYATPVVPQSVRTEVYGARTSPKGLGESLPALQQMGQFVVQTTLARAEVQDRTVATELAAFVSGQTGGLGRADVVVSLPDTQRPELPRATVQQLVDASVRATDQPVELVLNPEDLGRVRISMSMTDATVTLTVLAERSETLDLLRRHSEVLAQELRDLGYGKISFSFGQHGRGQGGHTEHPAALPNTADEPQASAVNTATPPPVQTGLDIRV